MAKILNIITHPNKTLREKSKNIKEEDILSDEIQSLASDMAKTMIEKDGIGLAAPQIGKNIRFIVVNSKNGILFIFNPKIIKKSILRQWGIEGCLSVPDIFGSVRRNKKITCCFMNQKGREEKIKAEGLLARVIQHEIDHLDGILFIDRAKNIEKEIKND